MMKPLTCLCLLAAAGSLLYLYQEKHSAQLIDREVAGLTKQADQIRERTGQLRAEWQMLNDPEQLAQLASRHLQLQPLAPTQYVRLADLASRLPGPVAPSHQLAPAMDDEPMPPTAALPAPVAPAAPPVAVAPGAPVRPMSIAGAAPTPATAAHAPVEPAPPRVAMALPRPERRPPARPREEMAAAEPQGVTPPGPPLPGPPLPGPPLPGRPLPGPPPVYAPMVAAFASQTPRQPLNQPHQPMVQRASAGLQEAPTPYVGSALGMARGPMAAPVPVSSATDLGSSYGR